VEQSVSHARPAIAEQIVSRGNAENYKEKNMNCKTWTRIIALTLFAALALPLQLAA
jgi:hypothetical protein